MSWPRMHWLPERLRGTGLQIGVAGFLMALVLMIPAFTVHDFRVMLEEIGVVEARMSLATKIVFAIPPGVWGGLAVLSVAMALVAAYRYRNVKLSNNQHSILTTAVMIAAGGILALVVAGLFMPLAASGPVVGSGF